MVVKLDDNENSRFPISCAVLAGGQSRRMGSDKALLEFDGQPLLLRTLQLLGGFAADVFVVGNRPEYEEFGAPVYADRFPGAGALGGIATALHSASEDFVLCVACDMPFLAAPLLRAMAKEPRDYDALVPIHRPCGATGQDVIEPLHAVYSRGSLGPIELRLRCGQLAITDALEDLQVHFLGEDWLRSLDRQLVSFWNVNTVDQLAAARLRSIRRSVEVEDPR